MNRSDSIDTTDGDEPLRDLPWSNESRRPFQFTLRRLLLFTVIVCAALGCIVNLPAILHWAYRQWEVGERFDQRTFEESQFALRITAFHQRGAFLGAPGGFYRYEVKTASHWRWRRIIMFRLPTPEPIPDDHLRRITDSCAYFFHGCVFGVTTDGGTSWSIKGGFDNPPIFNRQTDPNADIETVSIGQDGVGVMRLSNYDSKQWKPLPSHNLVSPDFGQTWTEH